MGVSRWKRSVRTWSLGACTALLPVAAGAEPKGQPEAPTAATGGVATPDQVGAKAAFEQGRQAWAAEHFEEACRWFRESQRLTRSAPASLNIGRCLEREGDSARARAAYQDALTEADANADAAKSELWRAAAREALARLGPEEPPPAAEAAPESGAPPPTPAPTPPAPVLAVGESGDELAPARAPGFFERPSTPWIFVGAGGALALGSIVTGSLALSAHSELERECNLSTPSPDQHGCPPEQSSTKDRTENLALATDILWISGTLFAAAGVTLWLVTPDRKTEAVRLECGPYACGARLDARF